MKEKLHSLDTVLFAAGGKVKISKEGCVELPVSFDSEQEVLFVKTEDGYELIPLVPDVKKFTWKLPRNVIFHVLLVSEIPGTKTSDKWSGVPLKNF